MIIIDMYLYVHFIFKHCIKNKINNLQGVCLQNRNVMLESCDKNKRTYELQYQKWATSHIPCKSKQSGRSGMTAGGKKDKRRALLGLLLSLCLGALHLRMSVFSGSSCSAIVASRLVRRAPWPRFLGWVLDPPLPGFSLSAWRGPLEWSCWLAWRSWLARGGGDEQKLRLWQRAPQFCSHCIRTLLLMASFTSSPQASKMFTSST